MHFSVKILKHRIVYRLYIATFIGCISKPAELTIPRQHFGGSYAFRGKNAFVNLNADKEYLKIYIYILGGIIMPKMFDEKKNELVEYLGEISVVSCDDNCINIFDIPSRPI